LECAGTLQNGILFITETKLDPGFTKNKLKIEGFILNYFTKNGEGIIFNIEDDMPQSRRLELEY